MDGRAGSAAGVVLLRLRVVTGGAEVLQVGAVHEAATVGEWDDVVDVGARDGQPVGGAVGTERVVAPDAGAQLTIATMRAVHVTRPPSPSRTRSSS